MDFETQNKPSNLNWDLLALMQNTSTEEKTILLTYVPSGPKGKKK